MSISTPTAEQHDEYATWLRSKPDDLSQMCAAQVSAMARLQRGEITLEMFFTITRELMPQEFWIRYAELDGVDASGEMDD